MYNKGVTDVTRFKEEVKKRVADPVTYLRAYNNTALVVYATQGSRLLRGAQ